jgi:plasmid stability protein
MASITLKALPVALHRTLRSQAAKHKRSLNQEVIAVLEEGVATARRVDPEQLIAEARQFRSRFNSAALPKEIDAFKREGRP